MTSVSSTSVEKILLVRIGHGGDLIMITPALNALLEVFPDAEFHLLTTSDGRRIMAGYNERMTRFFPYSRRFPGSLLSRRGLSEQLRAEQYSRIYIFETKPLYRRWMSRLAPEVHALAGTSLGRHYSDRCLDLVADTPGVAPVRGWVTLPVSDQGRQQARDLLTEHGVDPKARLVGLHPTFSGTGAMRLLNRRDTRHRLWPSASFARLATLLSERSRHLGLNLAVVIDALPEERKHVEPIIEQSAGAITLLTPPPNFQRYKSLLSLLDVMVTPNTGPMHVAAALGTPLVALFSDWSPEDCGPFMDPGKYRVLRAEDTEHPDRGLGSLEPEAVADAVMELLSEAADE